MVSSKGFEDLCRRHKLVYQIYQSNKPLPLSIAFYQQLICCCLLVKALKSHLKVSATISDIFVLIIVAMTLPPNDITISQPAMPGVEVNSNFDEMAETADLEPIEESEEESEEESDPDDDGGSRRAGRFNRSSKKGLAAGMLNYKVKYL